MVDQPVRRIKFEIIVIRDVQKNINIIMRRSKYVSKTSSGASWPQQCCEYEFLSCKQQDTKVEGCVIAVMRLHKVLKCVRFTRYQNKHKKRKDFFGMNDQGML